MMHEFLAENRGELIERCRMKVAQRLTPRANKPELDHGITLFLDQIIKTLKTEEAIQPRESLQMSGPSGGADAVFSEIGAAARNTAVNFCSMALRSIRWCMITAIFARR